MQFNDKKIETSPLLELSPASNVFLMDTDPIKTTFLAPGDDDDAEDEDGDWSDVDDEDFEDMAEDRDDLHEIQLDNDLFDDEDDDHLPDDDME